MIHLHVTCAIIGRKGLVLAAQRSATMSLPLNSGFPSGKIKSGEMPEECLKRELVEEMEGRVCVGASLTAGTHQLSTNTLDWAAADLPVVETYLAAGVGGGGSVC